MGQVVVVEADRGFVLVRSPLAASAQADGELVVKAQWTAETTGRLRVSPERKRNMVAADIASGAPKVGDVVYFLSEEKVVSTAPPPAEAGSAPVVAGGAASGVPAGGAALTLPDVMPPPVAGSGGAGAGELPPLGEPSGPREAIPDFPGLEPLPEAGDGAGNPGDSGVEPERGGEGSA
jgi:hypothetical protein